MSPDPTHRKASAQSTTKFRIVGLVTARGGSRGIPRKNLVDVAGKPLIAWTIEAARASQSLNRLLLSTDNEEIARVGQEYGADVPFMRPNSLARDTSPHNAVIRHAIEWLNDNDAPPDFVVLLQPTSPLRLAEDIDNAVDLALEKQSDCVISVCPAPIHPYWTVGVTRGGRLRALSHQRRGVGLRRQSLPKAYALNGAIYVINCRSFMQKMTYFTPRTFAYVMPQERSVDIDTDWDLKVADLVLRAALPRTTE
jgi:CMP-N,N'-diacetyllegionaminic acid synthase